MTKKPYLKDEKSSRMVKIVVSQPLVKNKIIGNKNIIFATLNVNYMSSLMCHGITTLKSLKIRNSCKSKGIFI